MKNFCWLSFWSILFHSFFFIAAVKAQQQAIDSLLNDLAKAEEDTNKVRTYFKLYNHYSFNDYEKSKSIIDDAFDLAQKLNDKRGIILCYDKWGGVEMNHSNFRKAKYYYEIADSLLEKMNWPREQAVIYGNYAGIYKDIGMYDSAIHWNNKFIELADAMNNHVFKAYGLGITGDLYQTKGQYNLAAKYHMQSLRIYEAEGNESRMGDAFLKLGEAHLYGNRYEDAAENLKKAAEIYIKIHDDYYLKETYDDLAYLYFQQKNYDLAQNWYEKADSIAQLLNDPYGIAQATEGYENIAFAQGQYELARSHNQKAITLYSQIEDRYNIAWRHAAAVNILLKLKNYNNALAENKFAEKQFKSLNLPSGLRKVYQNYYYLYKETNQNEKALIAFEKYNTIKDSLNNTKTQSAIEELQLIYDVEKKDQALVLLNKEKDLLTATTQVDQLKKQRLTWSIILLSLLAALIIYSQYSLRKRNQKIQEERNRRQALELEKNQIEKQQVERELAAQVLQLCRKNELLSSVKQEVADIAKQGVPENKLKLQKLERHIERDIQSDEDWQGFLSSFEKVHPDFLSSLRQKVDRLSPAEQRLSCLYKMNLSSKEIATLLNITDEGVKKARYRLRKKLALDSSINLKEFLITL